MTALLSLRDRIQELPAELFCQIQDLVFQTPALSSVEVDRSWRPPSHLQVSRLTRKKARESYYLYTTFVFVDFQCMIVWLRAWKERERRDMEIIEVRDPLEHNIRTPSLTWFLSARLVGCLPGSYDYVSSLHCGECNVTIVPTSKRERGLDAQKRRSWLDQLRYKMKKRSGSRPRCIHRTSCIVIWSCDPAGPCGDAHNGSMVLHRR